MFSLIPSPLSPPTHTYTHTHRQGGCEPGAPTCSANGTGRDATLPSAEVPGHHRDSQRWGGGREGEEERDEGLYNLMPTFLSSDELCEDVRMGGEYSVIGIPIHTLTESSTHTQVTTMVEVSSSGYYHFAYLLPFGAISPTYYHSVPFRLLTTISPTTTKWE